MNKDNETLTLRRWKQLNRGYGHERERAKSELGDAGKKLATGAGSLLNAERVWHAGNTGLALRERNQSGGLNLRH